MLLTAISIVLSLILLESLLSIDNAAVLSIMVKPLPPEQRNKALHYGIWGAYLLRGVCLLFASFLIKVTFLKIIGGLYLCRLTYTHFTKETDSPEEGFDMNSTNWITWVKNKIGLFWSTIVLVEIMDLAFSLDNIFAAVALTENIKGTIFGVSLAIVLTMIGVFIGILAMRYVANKFTVLMEKYPSLENSAFLVIAILGLKLIISGILNYIPNNPITPVLENHITDFVFSFGTLIVFLWPMFFGKKK